ncbi:UNVERIFIED_CONTAM: hypothetical protein Sindi_2482200, partial [Sesamum indicum]
GEDEIGFLITTATDRRKNTPGELGTENNWVVLATEEHHVPAIRILSPVGSDDVCSSFEIVQFLTLAYRIVDDGDVASLTALETFKKKWELRYGPIWSCHVLAVCLARGLRMARRAPYQQDLGATSSPPALAPASLIPSFSAVQTAKTDTITVVESLSVSVLMPVVACSMMDVAVSPVHTLSMIETISATLSMMIVSTVAVVPQPVMHQWWPLTQTGLFVSNIPLHFCLNIPNIVIRPTLKTIRNGLRRWNSKAIGYFLGKRPFFHHLNDYVKSIWPLLIDVTVTSNGFFFFRFKTIVAMEEIIEGGPWLFQGQSIVLQKWEPGMVMRKLKHTQVPMWVQFQNLPMELWTNEGLSLVASGIGRPLYQDAITRACTRLNFARVCVMLDVTMKLPKHLVVMSSTEERGEVA